MSNYYYFFLNLFFCQNITAHTCLFSVTFETENSKSHPLYVATSRDCPPSYSADYLISVPKQQLFTLEMTKPSAGSSNYDMSKGGSQVMFSYSDNVCQRRMT